MSRFLPLYRLVYLCVLVISCSPGAFAQQAVFSANASASRMGLQDQIQVDYTIENVENLRCIMKPDFRDFNVVGGPFSSQRSNISITNKGMVKSQSVTQSYVLQPKRTGTLTIPPASAKDGNGNTYESNALTVEVVKGSLAPQQQASSDPFNDPFYDPFAAMMQQRQQALQARRQRDRQSQQAAPESFDPADIDKNLFIKVNVDKSKAYVGEQITASYKLYARIPMNMAISKLPSLNGFWTQDFVIPGGGNIKPTEEVIDGKTYQVFLLKKSALFPQQTGTLILDPAEAQGQARIVTKVKQRNPFGGMFDDDPFMQQFGSLMMSDPFFNDDFFNTMAYHDVPVKLKSKPVKIEVLPLPANGKPEHFGNAVGRFTVTSSVDKTNLTTDDALTYTLKITGSGNLKLIEAPSLELPNGLSTYDPLIIDTITGRTTAITGSKIITYTISPNIPGDYEIPSVKFSYFNPEDNQYHSLETDPVHLHVIKGHNHNDPSGSQMLTDIHENITTPLKKISFQERPLFFTVGYWSMFALPVLAFVGLLAWKRRDEEMLNDQGKWRSRRANKIANKRLARAQTLLNQKNREGFYEEISKAIWLYISDKCNIPLSILSREKAEEALRARQVPEGLLQQINSVVTACETALYTPADHAQHMQQTYKDAVQTISKMEETIG